MDFVIIPLISAGVAALTLVSGFGLGTLLLPAFAIFFPIEIAIAATKEFFLVGLGGALGAVARWSFSGFVLHHTSNWRFPLGTFLVNLIGCIAAGIVAGLITKQDMFSASMRLFLLTGLLGGFTTFSAFGVETTYLIRRGELNFMALYVLISVGASLGGLMLAMRLIPGQAHPH
jgi:CrcB protein